MGDNRAIIYEAEGANHRSGHLVTEHRSGRTTIVASDLSTIVDAALALVDDGATRIELCGGLGPVWQARVADAVGERASVGAVMWGFESLTSAARYKARFEEGAFLPAAFIHRAPGADPVAGRTIRDDGATRTVFVPVPDAAAAARMARELVAEGVELIELYGGLGPDAAALVIEAVQAAVPVGVVS